MADVRRPRISEAETRRRVLTVAGTNLSRAGLTVSALPLSMEDVIREAGVARSAAYRIWPNKDAFSDDVIRHLAQGIGLSETSRDRRLLADVLTEHAVRLATPEGRSGALYALISAAATADLETVRQSSQWRMYLSLTATFNVLPDHALADEVRNSLATAERSFIASIADSYLHVATHLGMGLRSADVGYETIAHLGSAVIRGLAVKSFVDESIAHDAFSPTAMDVPNESGHGWSMAGLGLAALFSSFVVVTDDSLWDEGQVSAARAAIVGTG